MESVLIYKEERVLWPRMRMALSTWDNTLNLKVTISRELALWLPLNDNPGIGSILKFTHLDMRKQMRQHDLFSVVLNVPQSFTTLVMKWLPGFKFYSPNLLKGLHTLFPS